MKRLLNLLNDSSKKIWILNSKYCPDQKMHEGEAVVDYSYKSIDGSSPFSVDAIRDIDKYNYETFSLAYNTERNEILGHNASDSRMNCIWDFYYRIKKEDIILFVTGKIIEGYYIVTGDKIKVVDDGEDIYHIWIGETIRFTNLLSISTRFGSPYLQTIDKFRGLIVDALKQKISIIPADGDSKDETGVILEYLQEKGFSDDVIERTLNLYKSGTLNFKEIKNFVDGFGERMHKGNNNKIPVNDALSKPKFVLTPEQERLVSNVFDDLKKFVSTEAKIKSDLKNGTLSFEQFTDMLRDLIKEDL